MKKGRELFVGSYRSLHQTPISPIQFQQTMSHSDPSNRYSYTPILNWNPQVHHYFLKAYGADHFSRISTALTYALRTTHPQSLLFCFQLFDFYSAFEFAGALLATPASESTRSGPPATPSSTSYARSCRMLTCHRRNPIPEMTWRIR